MKARTLVALVLVVAGAGVAAWWAWGRAATAPQGYRTALVERTDVRSLVSATGTVEAVTTVQVGTQVSGIVSELLVDFNDRVRAGQLLARIDPTLLQADVAAAEARLAASRANEARSKLDADRIASLHVRAAATDQEHEQARAQHAVDRAEVQSAEVALRRARRNLDYANILSPIDGTITRRDVDVGQTVNAGFSAPTLFVVVGDLAEVQVLVSVDEADIGRVKVGQAASVTVASWPDQPASGTVEQVRLQSTLEDNVVTYPVVVKVENPDGKLLPGMTATVELVVDEARDVLCAPNAALRYRPAEGAALAPGAAAPESPPAAVPANGTEGGRREVGRRGGGRDSRGGTATVWTVDAAGLLLPLPVKTGLRGATCTEVGGEGLGEGTALVVGVETGEANGASSPFGAPAATGWRPGGL